MHNKSILKHSHFITLSFLFCFLWGEENVITKNFVTKNFVIFSNLG